MGGSVAPAPRPRNHLRKFDFFRPGREGHGRLAGYPHGGERNAPGATMRGRALAVMLGAVLGGCVGAGGEPGPSSTQVSDPVAAGREASRAVWGVVPSAPRRKADLRPELIKGAAVAVAADTLLVDCRATEGRTSVGLVRHNKYRIARVTHGGAGQVCLLTVSEGPLNPAAGYRSFADLRVGEPVTALASRTSARVVLAQGWLIGKGPDGAPLLEVSSRVPASGSVVLVDGFGNLIGVGPAGPDAGVLLASPVGAAAGTFLASRDLRGSAVLLASLAVAPRTQPVRQETIAILNEDDHGSETASAPAETQATATDREDTGDQASASPASGSGGGETNPGAAAASGGGSGAIGAGAGGEEGAERPQVRDGSGHRGRRGGGRSSGRGNDDGLGDHGRSGDRGRRGGRGPG